MLYLNRHSMHFDDLISRMVLEYGDLGTCQWILSATDCPEYAAWNKANEPQVILIESSPGDGKSCLASFLSEQKDTGRSVTLHFFSTTALKAIPEAKSRSLSGSNDKKRQDNKEHQTSSAGPTTAANKMAANKSHPTSQTGKKDISTSSSQKEKNNSFIGEAIILRTLLWQLADKLTGENKVMILRTIVDKRRKLKARSQDPRELFNSSPDMWEIITSAPGVSEIRLIIDDVHLCDKKFIKKLTGALEKRESNVLVKVILTAASGRFKLELETPNSPSSLELKLLHLSTSKSVQEDIKKYIKKGLGDMTDQFSLEPEFTDLLEKQMLAKTGPWLWAKASLDKLRRKFSAWETNGKKQPWEFTPDIVPADSLDGAFNSLLGEVSPLGLQIIKWEALTYDIDRKLVVPLKEEDFKQMFRYSDNFPDVKPDEVAIREEVRPAAFIDAEDGSIKGFHPSLMDYVREKLITDDDRRDLAVICLKYLCNNKDYTTASFELLNSGYRTNKELLKLTAPSDTVLGLNKKNTRSRLLMHIMLHWPDHISILGEECSNSSFEHLQKFYAPGKRYFEAWHYYYRFVTLNEDDGWIYSKSSRWIEEPSKTSLLHIVASRGTLNLFKRCLPMMPQNRRISGSTIEPHIPFRWHAKRVSNPTAPVIDYQDSRQRSLLIHAMMNSSTSDIAIYLISQGADVDAPDDHNLNPLSWASYAPKNQYEIFLSLLQRGVKDPDLPDMDGDTPLLNALADSDAPAEVVALLCSTGHVNVNHKNNYGATPLRMAAGKNNLAAGKILLQCKDIIVNARDQWGISALILAASLGYNDFIKLLLERSDIDVDQISISAVDYPEGNCLGFAAVYGHASTVQLLLKDPRVKVNPTPEMAKEHGALCALAFAAGNGYEEVVSILLSDPRTETDCKGWNDTTPLISAASGGTVSIVNMLLCNQDVDIDAENKAGCSALACAVMYGHDEAAQVLVDSNATPKPQQLFKAAALSHKGDTDGSVFRWVLDRYINEIDIRITDDDGECALMLAARAGKTSSVDILLNRCKLDPNRTDNRGRTALMLAAKFGHHKVIRALMDDDRLILDLRDKEGRTALSHAAANGNADAVNWLLGVKEAGKAEKDKDGLQLPPKMKMDPNTTGPKGATAIIEAAQGGHTEVIEILQLYEEANFEHVDDDGRNALMHAAANGHADAAELLVEGRPVETESDNKDSSKAKEGETTDKTAAEKKPDTKDSAKEPENALSLKMMDPNFANSKGSTALIEAAEAGHEDVIEFLLLHGKVNLSHQDKDGRTALYYAAENNHPTVVKLLLDGVLTCALTASVDSYSTEKDYPYTVTCTMGDKRSWSLRRVHSDFQKLQLALLDGFKQEAGKTGLPRTIPYMPGPVPELTESIVKARKQYLNDYFQALLKLPANISNSVLVKKFFSPRPGDVETTADKAAKLSANNHKGPGGRTPLIEAARKGHVEVVEVLLAHENSALNHRDDEGRSALSFAIEKGSLAVVKALLGEKADKEVKDKEGKTPGEYLDEKHVYAKEIVRLLSAETEEKEEQKMEQEEKKGGEKKSEDKEDEEKKDEDGEKAKEEEEKIWKSFVDVAVRVWRWTRLRMILKKRIEEKQKEEEEEKEKSEKKDDEERKDEDKKDEETIEESEGETNSEQSSKSAHHSR